MKRNHFIAAISFALMLTAAVASADHAATKTMALVKSTSCPPAAAPACNVYQPCVTYRHCGCCDLCSPMVKQVLMVDDPCDCCCVAQISVCLPACCKAACVNSKCGLFGRRGVVTYSYDCGVCVTINFLRCGEVVVTYRGC
ncbi:MAG: hypothetical protein IT427_04855 [Pirellulales bacterium]|nr:hypothetical protein [Pirellulales bacterium]